MLRKNGINSAVCVEQAYAIWIKRFQVFLLASAIRAADAQHGDELHAEKMASLTAQRISMEGVALLHSVDLRCPDD